MIPMRTMQLPLYHFLALDFDDSGSSIGIDRIYVPRLRMFVPYLSVPVSSVTNGMDLLFVNNFGRVPYAVCLPQPVCKYGDWREQVVIRRRSKMRWWRLSLPECSIRDQYAAAERYEIRGYTSIKAIESGAVIRGGGCVNGGKEHMKEDLRTIALQIRGWDGEDVCKMYAWMLQVEEIRKALDDDAFVTSVICPHDLPVGSSPAPKNLLYVWSWDNHGRYIVGDRWTGDRLKIRRMDEIGV